MRWFMLFALISYGGGLLLWKADRRTRARLVLVLCLVLTFLLFFLRKI